MISLPQVISNDWQLACLLPSAQHVGMNTVWHHGKIPWPNLLLSWNVATDTAWSSTVCQSSPENIAINSENINVRLVWAFEPVSFVVCPGTSRQDEIWWWDEDKEKQKPKDDNTHVW